EPDVQKAEKKRDALLARLEELRKAKAPLAEVKRLIDKIEFYSFQDHIFNAYYYLSRREFERGEVEITLPALCLNDIVFVGLPGESFHATGRGVKECLEKTGRRVVTVSEINGDVGYLPVPEDIPGGDYEVTISIIDERGEPAIRKTAFGLLD
ncbi:MAG: hypothetical protein QF662_09245, partial [Phycisphaerae bacterium]|nr:hypothetical protein [Phycisphaerae bacterium]